MKTLHRAGAITAVIAFLILGAWNSTWLLISGVDVASAILVGLALLICAASGYCIGRAVDERGHRVGLLWAGRGLATAGAAFAVAFPATLYGEIVMLASQGKAPRYDIEAAIWHEFSVLPLALLPALLSLRWGRIAGITMLVLTAYGIGDTVYHFGGINYFPEAHTDLAALIEGQLPALVTTVLLLVGGTKWRGEPSLEPGRAGDRSRPRSTRGASQPSS
jgi:hypothetical protein